MAVAISLLGCAEKKKEVKDVKQVEEIYMNYKNRRVILMEKKNPTPAVVKALTKEMLDIYAGLQDSLDAGLDDGTDKARELQRHADPIKAAWDDDEDDADTLLGLVKRELSN